MTLEPAACLLLVALSATAGDEQHPRPSTGAPDRAVAFDPVYFEVAAATGGNVFFWTPGEFSRTPPLLLLADEDLIIAHGELTSGREVAIPVDAGIARLEVFAGVQARAQLSLLDPAGRVVEDGTEGATVQRTRLMLLASVDAPTPGVWKLALGGSGLFSLSARAELHRDAEPASFLGFRFVELRGRPGHEGYFERPVPPGAGELALCTVDVEAVAGVPAVDALTGDGRPLGVVAELVESAESEQLMRFRVPSEPYRIRVRGLDAAGRAFQRVEAALREPARP